MNARLIPCLALLLGIIGGIGLPLAPALSQSAPTGQGAPVILYVSPSGNDSWNGSMPAPTTGGKDGPFRTPGQALRAVRARLAGLRAAGGAGTAPPAVEIRLAGGTYPLTEPLVLTAADSGTTETRVRIMGSKSPTKVGTQPVLSGGTRLTGWKNIGRNRWQVTLPEVARGTWRFSQLYVNGERRFRPRLPKQGYYYIAAEVPPSPKAEGKGYDRFRYKAGDIDPAWQNRDDIEILPFHIWTMSRFPIAEIDGAQRVLTFNGIRRGAFSWSRFGAGNRYLVENVKEALTDPGEWYLDRKSGVLTYLAKLGENPNQDEVIAPRVEQLLKIDGASHINFRGIAFAHTGWNLGAEGYSSGQADIRTPAAITLTGSRDVVFDRCTVRNIGNYAVEMGAGTQNCRLDHCVLRDLGAGGVKIGTTTVETDAAKQAAENTVQDCVITGGGRVNPAGVGVWIGQSPRNKILHNRITDFYYTGITLGWTWGYGASAAHGNTIAFNDISHLGQGVLSDMGGIYTLGASPGTVLHHNRIHDIVSYDYGGWGIYFDEGTSGVTATNNLVYNCTSSPFHQHYGINNLVENNILALGREAQLIRSRADNNTQKTPDVSRENSFTIRRNIVYWNSDAPLFGSRWTGANFVLSDNLYWNAAAKDAASIVFPGGMNLRGWQTASGKDTGSVIADPGFVSPGKGIFTLPANSPAIKKIGFVPLDLSTVGPRGPEGPRGKAEDREQTTPRAFPPPPPPRPVADDWEEGRPGDRPEGAQLIVSEDTTVPTSGVRITNETAASGRQSLKFRDAPGQKNRWTPHLYYKPNFVEGTMTGGFAVKVGQRAVFSHEWRDNFVPYRVGPSLHIGSDGALTAGNKALTKLPLDTWVRFQIVCRLGARASGTYDLTVTISGQAPQQFRSLPCGSGTSFRKLHWWGFTSEAQDISDFYLDDVTLTNASGH